MSDVIDMVGADEPPRDSRAGVEKTINAIISGGSFARSDPNNPAGKLPRFPKIPGYEVKELLGQGGMAVVYKAVQVQLGRVCALKLFFRNDAQSADLIQRFLNEARMIAQFEHPNIVRIHNLGETEEYLYLDLEYVDGKTLDARLDGNPLPPDEAARLVETAARAIHYAHNHEIIHRDLKPANIMMDKDGSLKITDFGLAKSPDRENSPTRSGDVIGTPEYMSPEQADGRSESIGPETDVYSLGVVLYELITGRRPFVGWSVAELLYNILWTYPVSPRRLSPRIPRDLETICLKCLEKPKELRYRSALDLADDLGRLTRGEAILARPTPFWEKAWRWGRRNPAIAGLSACLIGVAVVAFVMIMLKNRDVIDERDHARRSAISEARAHREVQSLAVSLALEKGVALAAKGRADRGLLWMAHSLELMSADASGLQETDADLGLSEKKWKIAGLEEPQNMSDLKTAVRKNLGAWSSVMIQERGRLIHKEQVRVMIAVRRDGGQELVGLPPAPERNEAGANAKRLPMLLATGCDDGFVRLWNPETGELAFPPLLHGAPIREMVADRAGKRIAVSGGNTVRVWNVGDGLPVGKPLELTQEPKFLAFHPDGRQLVILAESPNAKIWDFDKENPVIRDLEHKSILTFADYLDGGRVIATTDASGIIRYWFSATGEFLQGFGDKSNCIVTARYTPDESRLILGCASLSSNLTGNRFGILMLNRATHEFEERTPREFLNLCRLQISPNGRIAAAGSLTGPLQIIALDRTEERTISDAHTGRITQLAFSPDSLLLASSSRDGSARIWSSRGMSPVGSLIQHGSEINDVTFDDQGRTLFTAGSDGKVRSWDLSRILPENQFIVSDSDICQFDVNPAGDLAALAGEDGSVVVRNIKTGDLVGALPGDQTGPARLVGFRSDGRYLLTGGNTGAARILDVHTFEDIVNPIPHGHWILSGCFHPDGKSILIGRVEGQARLWSLVENPPSQKPFFQAAPIGDILFHSGPRVGHEVWNTAFTPDGRTAVTGDNDGVLCFWNARTGVRIQEPTIMSGSIQQIIVNDIRKELYVLSKGVVHTLDLQSFREFSAPFGDLANRMSLSRDGRFLLTSQRDRIARVWDLQKRKTAGPPLKHDDGVIDAVMSPDGRTIATMDAAYLTRFWDAPTGLPVGPALSPPEAVIHRNESNEKLRFLPDGQHLLARTDQVIAVAPVPVLQDWDASNARVRAEILTNRKLAEEITPGLDPNDSSSTSNATSLQPPTHGELPAPVDALPLPAWHARLVLWAKAYGMPDAELRHLEQQGNDNPGDDRIAQRIIRLLLQVAPPSNMTQRLPTKADPKISAFHEEVDAHLVVQIQRIIGVATPSQRRAQLTRLAKELVDLGHYRPAKAIFDRIPDLVTDAAPQLRISRLACRLVCGNMVNYEDELRRILLEPIGKDAALSLIRTFIQFGRYSDAVSLCRKIHESQESDLETDLIALITARLSENKALESEVVARLEKRRIEPKSDAQTLQTWSYLCCFLPDNAATRNRIKEVRKQRPAPVIAEADASRTASGELSRILDAVLALRDGDRPRAEALFREPAHTKRLTIVPWAPPLLKLLNSPAGAGFADGPAGPTTPPLTNEERNRLQDIPVFPLFCLGEFHQRLQKSPSSEGDGPSLRTHAKETP